MKKGFTLIELLAVLVILVIIMAIATPIILGIIEDAKKSSNLAEVEFVLDGAEKLYVQSSLDESISVYFDGETNIYNNINLTSNKPKDGVVKIDNKGQVYLSIYLDNVCYTKDFTSKEIIIDETIKSLEECVPFSLALNTQYSYEALAEEQEFIVEHSGYYYLEAWGAQGGNSILDNGTRVTGYPENSTVCLAVGGCYGGNGAYTAGYVYLEKGTIIYLHVGTNGQVGQYGKTSLGGYNGGGNGIHDFSDNEADGGGGGATDFRLVSVEEENSLNSRVMVASGGGGGASTAKGNDAGGLKSENGNVTQTSGNSFGIGESAVYIEYNKSIPGAGGGYYGGEVVFVTGSYQHPSTGGTSYISGHTGAVAVTSLTDTTPKSGCTTGTTNNDCSVHYSNLSFEQTTMIDGDGYYWSTERQGQTNMPTPNNETYNIGVGNLGDGYAKVTYVGNFIPENNDNIHFEYRYTGEESSFTAPSTGYYYLQAWGAQGGTNGVYIGSYGAYTSGYVKLNKGETIYIQVGGQGKTATTASDLASAGYNGGSISSTYSGQVSGTGSGGATDFRLTSGAWNDSASLASRIMVAAGGVGVANWRIPVSNPAPGGGLIGYDGQLYRTNLNNPYTNAVGANQTSSGLAATGATNGQNGSFGIGGAPQYSHGSGGSGGYYGGSGGSYNIDVVGSGSSGSSYISGHTGAVAITSQTNLTPKAGCVTGTTDNSCSIHYSGVVLENTTMIDGKGYSWSNELDAITPMPTPAGTYYELGQGRTWNGYATVTYVGTSLEEEETKPDYYIYTGDYQTFTAEETGNYKLEAWGAAGGISMLDGGSRSTGHAEGSTSCMVTGGCYGGHGAYTSGEIYLEKGDIIYIYVGGQGGDAVKRAESIGGYNGGGNGQSDRSDDEADGAGGGATDFRLVSGTWNNTESLASRIMVAAGGSGASHYTKGASGGGLTSVNYGYSALATQIAGYNFGYGESGKGLYSNKSVSGASGGYYGGYATNGPSNIYDSPASAGTSYISGHTGAIAITSQTDITPKSGCTTETTDKSCSIHYSGLTFTNTTMIDGNGFIWTNEKTDKTNIPTPTGGEYNLNFGNTGNGVAKITYLGN